MRTNLNGEQSDKNLFKDLKLSLFLTYIVNLRSNL